MIFIGVIAAVILLATGPPAATDPVAQELKPMFENAFGVLKADSKAAVRIGGFTGRGNAP